MILQSKRLKKDWQKLRAFLSKVTLHSSYCILFYKAVAMSCPGSRRADISPLSSWTGECQRTCRHSPPSFHKVFTFFTRKVHLLSLRTPRYLRFGQRRGSMGGVLSLLFGSVWRPVNWRNKLSPHHTANIYQWFSYGMTALYSLIQNIGYTIKFIQVFHNTEEPKQTFWPTNKTNGSQSHWFIAFLKYSSVLIASLLITA